MKLFFQLMRFFFYWDRNRAVLKDQFGDVL